MSIIDNRNLWLDLLVRKNPLLESNKVAIQEAIVKVRKKENLEQTRNHFVELCGRLEHVRATHSNLIAQAQFDFHIKDNVVHIESHNSALTDSESQELNKIIAPMLPLLAPWRKGPFFMFDTYIDSEWQSYKKWQRLAELHDIDGLCRNRTILDVGCNNGYYSFYMLKQAARMVLAIDPMPRNSLFFDLYRLLMPHLALYFEEWGVADMELLPSCFDTVFCMGILYHQRNPLATLETLRNVLSNNGMLVLETICLNNDSDYCLFPSTRYQKAPGYWFIPSRKVLVSWLKRSGYEVMAIDTPTKTGIEEQRRTEWIRGESLEAFLHIDDDELTVEGYPAPYRVIVVAKKRY